MKIYQLRQSEKVEGHALDIQMLFVATECHPTIQRFRPLLNLLPQASSILHTLQPGLGLTHAPRGCCLLLLGLQHAACPSGRPAPHIPAPSSPPAQQGGVLPPASGARTPSQSLVPQDRGCCSPHPAHLNQDTLLCHGGITNILNPCCLPLLITHLWQLPKINARFLQEMKESKESHFFICSIYCYIN